MRKCRTLGREQRKRYIELGKYCEECNSNDPDPDTEGPSQSQSPDTKSKDD
jgi:hypothetical protein